MTDPEHRNGNPQTTANDEQEELAGSTNGDATLPSEDLPTKADDDPALAEQHSGKTHGKQSESAVESRATAPIDGPSPATSRATPPEARRPKKEVSAVLVRFRVPGHVAQFDAGNLPLRKHDMVVIEADHSVAVGTVIREVERIVPAKPLKRILRVVNQEDRRIVERNRVREREAFRFCIERIKARELPMKLVAVDLAHSGTRAVFYFSSADRVDFRALVKDLARRFHTRIEMRQIGVRDAARHIGGVGICGRDLCCATWLPSFKPISIRMAKDQNLALNHQKLSGLCGRLRCCLQYEQEIYQAQRKGLPRVGKRVFTPEGEGRVKDVNVLRRRVRVQLLEGGYAQFEADQVKRPADVQAARTKRDKQRPPSAPESESERTPGPQGNRISDRQSGEKAAATGKADSETSAPDTASDRRYDKAPRSSRRRRRRRGRRGRSGTSKRSKDGGGPRGGPSSDKE